MSWPWQALTLSQLRSELADFEARLNARLQQLTDQISQGDAEIMATFADLQGAIDKLKADVTKTIGDVNQKIADLKAQIAAGTAATPEQLDSAVAGLTALDEAINAEESALNPQPPEAA